MKALKHYAGVIILMSLSVLSACSDNITSPVNSALPENETTISANNKRGVTYFSSFTISPGEYILLDSKVTSLAYITEYSISNCVVSERDLFVSASNIDGPNSLPCSGSNFLLYDLMIENRSREVKKIEVKLTGIRAE